MSASAGPSFTNHVLSGTTSDVTFHPPPSSHSSLGEHGAPSDGGPSVNDPSPGDLEVLTVPQEDVEFPTRGSLDNVHFYKCCWENCGQWMPGDREQLELHLKYKHEVLLKGDPWSPTTCRWTGCGGELKKNSLLRHIEIHLGLHWRCSLCSQEYTRADSVSSHIRRNVQCESGRAVSVPSHKAYSAQRREGMVTLTKVLRSSAGS
ncbi:hypothetical protein F5I97DRAFT_1814951 [Phlebopus sp. FC_14]|nr:hypothetical protein F5I97DRAFT_1814951 [Phlebopus sp. FC_14]